MSDRDHDSDDESEGCLALVPDQGMAKPKRSYDLPHPSKRTKEQHLFAAHMMRERKAMMTSRRVERQSEEQTSNAIALLRDSGFFVGKACENQACQRRR